MNQLPNQSATYTDTHGNQVEDMMFTYSEEERQQNEINRENAKLVFNPKFVPFYPLVMSQYNITYLETLLFGFVEFYLSSNHSGRFYFTNEQLGEILNSSVNTISRAISNLSRLGLIKTKTKIRSGGGSIRFIEFGVPDSPKSVCQTPQVGESIYINNNKINKNKINNKERNIKERKFSSLSLLGDLEIKEIAEKYQVPESFVTSKLDDLKNYCDGRGKKYKNYYATLQAWVKKDAIKVRKENHGPRIVKVA